MMPMKLNFSLSLAERVLGIFGFLIKTISPFCQLFSLTSCEKDILLSDKKSELKIIVKIFIFGYFVFVTEYFSDIEYKNKKIFDRKLFLNNCKVNFHQLLKAVRLVNIINGHKF